MAIIQATPRPVYDLRGSDGNAFVLIGHARGLARSLGEDPEDISKKMMSLTSYVEIVSFFEMKFGRYVDIILPSGIEPREVLPPQDINF